MDETIEVVASALTTPDRLLQRVEREVGFAIIHAAGASTADDVVFGEEDDFALLGVRSLEGLNLRLDVVRKQLIDAGPMLAAVTQS